MVCGYLMDIQKAGALEDPNNYYGAVACHDPNDRCPKKKLRHIISAHCWRYKS